MKRRDLLRHLQQLEHRVGAQALAQRLQPDRVAGCHVAQVDLGSHAPDEVRLQVLGRRLEDDPPRVGAGGAGPAGAVCCLSCSIGASSTISPPIASFEGLLTSC